MFGAVQLGGRRRLNQGSSLGMTNTLEMGMESIIERVPPLSEAATEALEEFGKPNCDSAKLSVILGADPFLVGRILSVANSPFYGRPRQIASLKDACVILGQHTLRNIVIAAAAMEAFQRDSKPSEAMSGFWEHSNYTAGIAYRLAVNIGQDSESAFTAGLLHEIGAIAIESLEPGTSQLISTEQQEKECGTIDAERNLLGYTHADLGAEIARYWNLPEGIVSAVRHHHDPEAIMNEFCDLIYVADRVARAKESRVDGALVYAELVGGVVTRLQFSEADLLAWFEDMPNYGEQ